MSSWPIWPRRLLRVDASQGSSPQSRGEEPFLTRLPSDLEVKSKPIKAPVKDSYGDFKTLISAASSGHKATLEWAWLKAHRHEYPGQWLAVSGGRLIAHGTSYEEVREAGIAQVGTDFMMVFSDKGET